MEVEFFEDQSHNEDLNRFETVGTAALSTEPDLDDDDDDDTSDDPTQNILPYSNSNNPLHNLGKRHLCATCPRGIQPLHRGSLDTYDPSYQPCCTKRPSITRTYIKTTTQIKRRTLTVTKTLSRTATRTSTTITTTQIYTFTGLLFIDNDRNGNFTTGDAPAPNQPLLLLASSSSAKRLQARQSSNVVGNTTTDQFGNYSFLVPFSSVPCSGELDFESPKLPNRVLASILVSNCILGTVPSEVPLPPEVLVPKPSTKVNATSLTTEVKTTATKGLIVKRTTAKVTGPKTVSFGFGEEERAGSDRDGETSGGGELNLNHPSLFPIPSFPFRENRSSQRQSFNALPASHVSQPPSPSLRQ